MRLQFSGSLFCNVQNLNMTDTSITIYRFNTVSLNRFTRIFIITHNIEVTKIVTQLSKGTYGETIFLSKSCFLLSLFQKLVGFCVRLHSSRLRITQNNLRIYSFSLWALWSSKTLWVLASFISFSSSLLLKTFRLIQ